MSKQKEHWYRAILTIDGGVQVFHVTALRKSQVIGQVLRRAINKGHDISELHISITDITDTQDKVKAIKGNNGIQTSHQLQYMAPANFSAKNNKNNTTKMFIFSIP